MKMGGIGIEPAEIDGRIPEHVKDDEQDQQLACRSHHKLSGYWTRGKSHSSFSAGRRRDEGRDALLFAQDRSSQELIIPARALFCTIILHRAGKELEQGWVGNKKFLFVRGPVMLQ